jgi:poly(hydroxyalkanoate) granule-associated protein
MTRSKSNSRSTGKSRNHAAPASAPAWRGAVEQAVKTGKEAAALVQQRGLEALQVAQQRSARLTEQARAAAQARIEPVAEKVVGAWMQAEKVTSDRVGRTLNRLGVPSQKDIDKLTRSVAKLSSQIDQLAAAAAKPARSARSGSRRASATA